VSKDKLKFGSDSSKFQTWNDYWIWVWFWQNTALT